MSPASGEDVIKTPRVKTGGHGDLKITKQIHSLATRKMPEVKRCALPMFDTFNPIAVWHSKVHHLALCECELTGLRCEGDPPYPGAITFVEEIPFVIESVYHVQ